METRMHTHAVTRWNDAKTSISEVLETPNPSRPKTMPLDRNIKYRYERVIRENH